MTTPFHLFLLRVSVHTQATSVCPQTGGRGVLRLPSAGGEGTPGSPHQKRGGRRGGKSQRPSRWRQASGSQQQLCRRRLSPWGKISSQHWQNDRSLPKMQKKVSNWSYCVSLFLNQVARKIKLSGHQLCLLVLDGEEYELAVSRGQDLQSLARVHKSEGCKAPRLCHITRDPVSGLGINFTPVEGNTACGNHKCKVPD